MPFRLLFPVTWYACPILLYHSISEVVPEGMERTLHNVTPTHFAAQIRMLGRYFDILPLQRLLRLSDWRGKAAVTFDDAYASVFDTAVPILSDAGVPATVFVSERLAETRWFWRDGIRHMIRMDLVQLFLEALDAAGERPPGLDECNFYRASKHPGLDSAWLDERMRAFLADQGEFDAMRESLSHLLAGPQQFVDHPLLDYGNHSRSHYVMASLSAARQREEVLGNQAWLARNAPRPVPVFALPFGGAEHMTADLYSHLHAAGVDGLMMSRQRINLRPRQIDEVTVAERLMPADQGSVLCSEVPKTLVRTLLDRDAARLPLLAHELSR